MEYEEYRNRAKEFICKITNEFYMNRAGLKDSLNSSEIYAEYNDLFEKEKVLKLMGSVDLSEHDSLLDVSEKMLRMLYLKAFAIDGFLDTSVRGLTDKIVSSETQTTIEFQNQKIPYRAISVILANEANAELRKNLDLKKQNVIRKLNPIREERITHLHSLADELGYSDYLSLYTDIKGFDFSSLTDKIKEFLHNTDSIYTYSIEKAASTRLGLKLSEVNRHDISFLFRGTEFDPMFPENELIANLEKTVDGMGLGRELYPNIDIDIESREGKSPRAFCAPLRIPDEIVLVLMPHGGHDDYETILHEAGHAWHFASVLPDQEFEYKYLGDNSITESYAFLFQYLTMNEHWLSEYIHNLNLENYMRFSTLKKLYMLRRYAAKFLYELKLHKGNNLSDMSKEYSDILSDALKIQYPAVYYLEDLDDGFYSAQYLRAWIFESQLKKFFMKRFGERAYAYPETGDALREMFAGGQKFTVEELSKRLGLRVLDLDPLYEEIHQNL